MRILLATAMIGAFGVLVYDETRGRQFLSKTLRGEENGLDLAPVKEHGRLLALLALVLFLVYLADEKLSIMLGVVIFTSILLTRGWE